MSANNDEYRTTREAAEMLGVSLRTVQLWVENGTLEAWKTEGGHRRVSQASILRMLERTGQSMGVAGPANGLDRLKILVVEDDDALLKLYKLRIASWGLPIDVITASNGYDGLVLVGRESPDILITDLAMPGLDGFQMVRTLYHSPFREGMDIIVVSGLPSDEILSKGQLPERIRIFAKPVPFDALREICRSHLAYRQTT